MPDPGVLRDLIVVAGAFFLLGCLVGWIIGQRTGFDDGIEAEKRRGGK